MQHPSPAALRSLSRLPFLHPSLNRCRCRCPARAEPLRWRAGPQDQLEVGLDEDGSAVDGWTGPLRCTRWGCDTPTRVVGSSGGGRGRPASQASRDRRPVCDGGTPCLFSWWPVRVSALLVLGQRPRPCPAALALRGCRPSPSLLASPPPPDPAPTTRSRTSDRPRVFCGWRPGRSRA